jgi:hypothetical protein
LLGRLGHRGPAVVGRRLGVGDGLLLARIVVRLLVALVPVGLVHLHSRVALVVVGRRGLVLGLMLRLVLRLVRV